MAGEMTQKDLEEGGEFYETRITMEDFVRKAAHKCTVKVFDKYQGPFAEIRNHHQGGGVTVGTLWLGENEGEYLFKYDDKQDGIVVSSSDELFEYLIAVFELFYLDIKLLAIKDKNQLVCDLVIDGEKWKNIKLGPIPNKHDVKLVAINKLDQEYIELGSDLIKGKRVINL